MPRSKFFFNLKELRLKIREERIFSVFIRILFSISVFALYRTPVRLRSRRTKISALNPFASGAIVFRRNRKQNGRGRRTKSATPNLFLQVKWIKVENTRGRIFFVFIRILFSISVFALYRTLVRLRSRRTKISALNPFAPGLRHLGVTEYFHNKYPPITRFFAMGGRFLCRF